MNISKLDIKNFAESDIVATKIPNGLFITLITSEFPKLRNYYLLRQRKEKQNNGHLVGAILYFKNLEMLSRTIPESYLFTGDSRSPFYDFQFIGKQMYVCSDSKIYTLNKNGIQTIIDNKYFNDLHSIDVSNRNNLLVSSSGIDSVIELNDTHDKAIWSWTATKESISSNSKEPVSKLLNNDSDYNKTHISTKDQFSHLNSSIYVDDNEKLIGITLFHQGKLIILNRETGEVKTILEGMSHPHGFNKFPNGFVVTDTRNGVVYFFNKNLEIIKTLWGFEDSLDSAPIWLQNTYHVVENIFVTIDQNNYKIIFFDLDTMQKYTVFTPKTWKIYKLGFNDVIKPNWTK